MFDVLIKNGLIVDGTGKAAFRGDVAVKDGKIVRVAPGMTGKAKRYLDTSGLVVAPGFIDCHNHSDSDVFLGSSCYNSLEQGVTTQITGHCGYSPAPYYEGAMVRLKRYMPKEQFATAVAAAKNMRDFLSAAEQASLGTNMAFFVGHHNIRGKTMGFGAETPTATQLWAMQTDLTAAMEAGCLGMSTGLIYSPSAYADTRELIALAKAMAPYGGVYASHVRNESDHVVEAVGEAIRIGEEAGVQVHISHIKVMGRHNEGLSERLLQMIDDANARGVAVYADQYPYYASSATLNSRIPAQYHAGGIEKLLERLQEPNIRNEINGLGLDYDGMFITTLPYTSEYENKTVGEIARTEGKRPVDVLCELLLVNQGSGQGIYFNQSELDMLRILSHPRVFAGSDSSNFPDERFDPASIGGRHPRGQATMVRRLALQRDHGLCTLEEAVHRITGGPAKAFHLDNHGLLRKGLDANITIFDYDGLCDHATYQHPYLDNEGIKHVLVNGELAVSNGRITGIRAGKILRRGK